MDANIIFLLYFLTDSRQFSVPVIFVAIVSSGNLMLLSMFISAAKCIKKSHHSIYGAILLAYLTSAYHISFTIGCLQLWLKLSIPVTSCPDSLNLWQRWLPTNPAPPVTNIFIITLLRIYSQSCYFIITYSYFNNIDI